MEENDFLTTLYADGSATEQVDLEIACTNYKELLGKLPSERKGIFSLNVLCMLTRNVDKVPSWRDKIDVQSLLNLSIECLRQTRGLESTERVKELSCVYFLQKFMVGQSSPLPPELLLKFSYMLFEYEQGNLLPEYYNSYWDLIADRLQYIQELKSGRRAIIKLLPKLTEDIQKVILMYDSVQFCNTILVSLVKKLFFLYNTEHAKDLNAAFGMIFESLSLKKDVEAFKKLSEMETLELYVKFSDCFYVIAENATKLNFKDSTLTMAVKTCIAFIGHVPDVFHCLQTFYLNSFCSLLTENDNLSFSETVLNSLIISCLTTEELGYYKAVKATYPYINQLFRVYIEYHLTKKNLTQGLQETCLKLIILLLDKLKDTEQMTKCDKCKIKSGLHDAFELLVLAENVVSPSLNSKFGVTMILQPYLIIIKKQHSIVTELCRIGCANHEKCLWKLQTNIQKTAILLYTADNLDSAIQLFDIYLTHEFLHFKTTQGLKNIIKALHNKSVSELKYKLYEEALLDGFLSLVFAQLDRLKLDNAMNLVIEVKAKALNACDDEELQMMTVLEACDIAVGRKLYWNLMPFFYNLEFGPLLHHEFSVYARLRRPSLAAVAGVWRALHGVATGKRPAWMCAQPSCLDTLYSVILQTPTAVHSIHNQHLSAVLSSVIDTMPATGDTKMKITEATMLFLKAEMDLADAGVKYEWEIEYQSINPDLVPCCQTLEQEHKALQPALRAVRLWTEVLPHLDEMPPDYLSSPLQVLRVMLQQLLYMRSALALPLANVALRVSIKLDDREAYIEAAGAILSRAYKDSSSVSHILAQAAEWADQIIKYQKTLESALVLFCDLAIFYHNIKEAAMSAKYIRVVQASLLNHMDSLPLAVGRLFDAQALNGDLSASANAYRQYFSVGNTESGWCLYERRSLVLKRRLCAATARYAALARTMLLWRRARSGAAAALAKAAAARRADLALVALDPCRCDAARATIDQRLKRIIGLQTNECALQNPPQLESETNQALFTLQPKLDTMRDTQIPEKLPTSPSIPIEYAAAYKAPEFLNHDHYCECYACDNPAVLILTLRLLGIEASVYFRAKEVDLAKNYFEGVLGSICSVENKINDYINKLRDRFEKYVVDIVEKSFERQLFNVELEVLIQGTYFELSQQNYAKSEEYIVRLYDILQAADIDAYSENEVYNLMTASEVLRKAHKIPDRVTKIENDMEDLKLTLAKEINTPEAKPTTPPLFDEVVVNKDELPDLKRKIPVLNFDEPEGQHAQKKKIWSKTPILVTQPSYEDVVMTPLPGKWKVEFVTPQESTPYLFFSPEESTLDLFSTPEISVKTYVKKSLRQNIVRNLDQEFAAIEYEENILKRISKTTKVAESDLKKNAKPNTPKRKTKIE